MSKSQYIVVDRDPLTANALVRALGEFGYAYPVATLSEVGAEWPEFCMIFVADRADQLNDAIEFVRERGVFYPIIPYSDEVVPQRVVETIRCGAMSYLSWPSPKAQLVEVLSSIEESSEALLREKAARERAFFLLKTLTRKETEVLNEIATGASSRQISKVLGISHRTVEAHRSNIIAKLKVPNAIAAVRMALEPRLPRMTPSRR
ncbi:DNA-binding response regulator, NarL/FixJ family, contains REC and HTH domains [Qipengyuania nanhaisediminis]|uniref:DNA-binding response regulator, NarL/FixJ family, contains REC and HTH domains n=1 Tax=Qipengyuania nanhaisediminis TaxID=604088 RepID=A0A1I5M9L6_9SPHN|nr:DNA-binding response regulator, NarL/FixJ family, contains REC and HTH domains [Qipengyuania nanhaisediminis]